MRWLTYLTRTVWLLSLIMYLGVHDPSDVAAGWIASTAWVLSVYFLFSPYLRKLEQLWAGGGGDRA